MKVFLQVKTAIENQVINVIKNKLHQHKTVFLLNKTKFSNLLMIKRLENIRMMKQILVIKIKIIPSCPFLE